MEASGYWAGRPRGRGGFCAALYADPIYGQPWMMLMCHAQTS